MFLSIDGTFWIQLVNFAIFFAILNAVFLRPVGAAIRKRREYIDGVKSDFERYTAESRSLQAGAEAKRAQARREAEETLAKARAGAESEALALAATFTERANAIADDARARVETELRAAREREAELAKTLAGELLERAIGSAR
jgi:F0F1-type ATP synthase membrane subunit b/b'